MANDIGKKLIEDRLKKQQEKGTQEYSSRTGQKIGTEVYVPDTDTLYRQYAKAREQKVAGGTVNPMITTQRSVQGNRNLMRPPAETYAEAAERNRMRAAELSAGLEGAKATAQDVKDILFSGRNYTHVNPTYSFGAEYDTMTPEEAGAFVALTKQGRTREAKDYLDALQIELNRRNTEKVTQMARETAERNAIAGVGLDVAGAMSSGAGALYSLWQEARGQAIDPHHPAYGGVALREGAYEGLIGDSTGIEKFLKEAGITTAEWAGQAFTMGGLAPFSMAAGAAGATSRDATMRGGTTEEAVMLGIVGGAAEAVAEKIGFDRWLKFGDMAALRGNKGQLVAQILKDMGSEGLEEGATEIANILADTVIMGDKSLMAEIYDTAKANGMTEAQAIGEALKTAAGQIGYSAGLGAVSGGMIGGGMAAMGRATGQNPIDRAREQYEAATRRRTPAITEEPVRDLEAEYEEQVKRENEEAVRNGVGAHEGVSWVQTVNPSAEGRTHQDGGNSAAETAQEELEGFGERFYGKNGKEIYLKKAKEAGNFNHTAAFNVYYAAGVAGIRMDEIKGNAYTAQEKDKMMLNEAYMAGAADSAAVLAKAIIGKNKLTGKRGLILDEDVKATDAQMALADFLGKAGGVQIRLVNKLEITDENGKVIGGANGKIQDGVITLALDTETFVGTAIHEMVHHIRSVNPAGYDALRKTAFRLANTSGINIGTLVDSYKNKYEEAYGENINMEDVLEEATADAFQKILNDEAAFRDFVAQVKKQDESLIAKIKEFLDKLMQTLEGLLKDNRYTSFAEALNKDLENTRKLRAKFAEVLAETGKMEAGAEGVAADAKFSIRYTEDGRAVAVVDRDILKDLGAKEWEIDEWNKDKKNEAKRIARQALKQFGEAIPVNGIQYRLNKDMRDEYTKSKSTETLYRNKEAFADKMRLADNADDVIMATTNWKPEKAENPSKDYIKKFVKGDVLFISGGRKYEARTVVGVDMFGEFYFYDVTWVEKADFKLKEESPSNASDKVLGIMPGDSSANSVAQKGNNGNRDVKFSFAGERAKAANGEMLATAKRMEQEGKTNAEILRKTGWFRGMDRKWRFEMDDSAMEFFRDGDAHLTENKEYQRYKEMLRTGDFFNSDFERLDDIYRGEWTKKIRFLNQYIKHETLFRNYPFLQGTKIVFEDLGDIKGSYSSRKNQITLDKRFEGEYMSEPAKRTLLHEIQHAIQYYEGFTGGSSPEYWEARKKQGFSKRKNEKKFQRADERYRKLFDKAPAELQDLIRKVNQAKISGNWGLVGEVEQEISEKGYDDKYFEIGDADFDRRLYYDDEEMTAYELYQNTAGEIEARDTANRKDLTAEQRKEKFPDQGSDDTVFVDGVKFSIKKESVEANIADSEHWKAAYYGLLREFEITREPLRDRESGRKVVSKFLKEIKSGYSEEDFLNRFMELCNYGVDLQSDSDYKDLVAAMTMLTEDALKESADLDMEAYNKYADLRKQLRSGKLFVSRDTMKDLEAQDRKYADLRKENFGRVTMSSKEGEAIDTQYATWAEEYPELFKLDQHTSHAALLLDIIAVRNSLDPVVNNPYFDQLEDYAESYAYELLGRMNDIALEKPTFADKYEAQLRKLREESKEALRKAREQAKHEKELLKKKYADNAEARLEAAKQKYEKRMDRKEYWRLRKLAVKDAKALAEWLKKPTDKNHVPQKFKEGVETVLALIETEKPDLKIALQDFVAMKGGVMELYGDGQGMFLYREKDERVVDILDMFIQKYPNGANLDAMSGTDMKYFRELIASVKKACTDANKLHTSQRERSTVELSEGFINESQKKKDARETGIVRRINDFLGLEMLDANSFFKRIGGDVYNELWKGLRKGMDKKVLRWKEAMDFINEVVDPKTVRKWTDEPAKEFMIDGKKVYLSVPQIMSLSCLMRREQARQHIIGAEIATETKIIKIRGGGFKAEVLENDKAAKKEKPKVVEPTEAEIKAIIGSLTEEQARVAYAIQKFMSENVAAWGNETTMLMFGYERFGTPNYFPIVSDKNFINQLVTKTEDIAPTLRSMGLTKNVNQYANNPVIIQDIFRVFANHVDQMSNYNAFVPSESDFNKFLNYKVESSDGKIYSVREEMDRTMGKGGEKYIKTLMNRLVTASGLSDDSDFAKMLVRNMKVASVGANLRVILQQPTAYLRALNYISPKYALNPAVFKKVDLNTVHENAPISLWKEWGNYEMDTGKSMYEQIIAPTKAAWTKEKLLAGAAMMDKVTWMRLWNACMLEAKGKHPRASAEDLQRIAGERFSEIVDESQVVDSILHRSQIMRKKGLYTQMTTSFMSEPMKTFNMASNALVELVRNNTAENRKKFARCYATLILSGVATACAAGLADAMRDDDEEEEFMQKWLKAVKGDYSKAEKPKGKLMAALSSNIGDNLNPVGMIPYLRDAWSLIQGYDIKRTDFDWLNDILKNMNRWEKFIAGESEYTLSSMILNSAGAVSKMTGVPVASATRDLKALVNTVIYHISGGDPAEYTEMEYSYQKMSKEIGSEKNMTYYMGRMLQAYLNGDKALANKIRGDMIRAGVSAEDLDDKLKKGYKAALREAYRTGELAAMKEAEKLLRSQGADDNAIRSTLRNEISAMFDEANEEGNRAEMERLIREYVKYNGKEATLRKRMS